MQTRSLRDSAKSRRRLPELEGRPDRERPPDPPPAKADPGHLSADRSLIGLKHLF
jgi:hypothetical protein